MQERKLRFTSLSGFDTNRVYTHSDLKGWSPDEQLGAPGEFPYTRGVYPTMYRGRLWTMRQFAGFGSAEDTNRRFKYLLQHGQNGLWVSELFPHTATIVDDVSFVMSCAAELFNREVQIGSGIPIWTLAEQFITSPEFLVQLQ